MVIQKQASLSKAINIALEEILTKHPSTVLLGEDIGKLGGVFRVTEDLSSKFGVDHVLSTPLAEAGIVGVALGMAIHGTPVIAEIQFEGFIFTAFNEIVTQVSRMQARLEGNFPLAPYIIRIPCGSSSGGIEHHQESIENHLFCIPGLDLIYVSNPNDGYNLLKEAYHNARPTIFLEHKGSYWKEGEIRNETADLRAAKKNGKIVRKGSEVTMISWGPTVTRCLQAADELQKKDKIDVEVIDLRYLSPIDWELVRESITKTKNALICTEDRGERGVAAHLSHIINSDLDSILQTKPRIVSTPFDNGIIAGNVLQQIPQKDQITSIVKEIKESKNGS